jgi:hypothetical protein
VSKRLVSWLFNVERTDSQELLTIRKEDRLTLFSLGRDLQSHFIYAEREEETMRFSQVHATGLGAALMFLLDPDRGRRRRAWIGNKCIKVGKKTERALKRTNRDVRNRIEGLSARLRSLVS